MSRSLENRGLVIQASRVLHHRGNERIGLKRQNESMAKTKNISEIDWRSLSDGKSVYYFEE